MEANNGGKGKRMAYLATQKGARSSTIGKETCLLFFDRRVPKATKNVSMVTRADKSCLTMEYLFAETA